MTNELTPVSKAQQALAQATTPQEAKQVEALSNTAKTWAKETENFEALLDAGYTWLMARRKFTELVAPLIEHGGDRRSDDFQHDLQVRLKDFDLTFEQLYKRRKELEVSPEEVEEYVYDYCFREGKEPTRAGLLKHYLQIIMEADSNEWWTPKKYIDSVRKVLGNIDLDPASCEEANKIVQADTFYTEADNGLEKPWFGKVFMNPPYGEWNKYFAKKLQHDWKEGNVDMAIALHGAHAIETSWFRKYWDHTLCFTGHRIKFDTPNGQAIAGNIAGSAFIYLGNEPLKFAEEFKQHGYVVRRWPSG